MESIAIRNCGFADKCPMTWQTLTPTGQTDVRYCPKCDRGVHLCRNEQALMDALRANRCVAIPATSGDRKDESNDDWFEDDDTYLEQ